MAQRTSLVFITLGNACTHSRHSAVRKIFPQGKNRNFKKEMFKVKLNINCLIKEEICETNSVQKKSQQTVDVKKGMKKLFYLVA